MKKERTHKVEVASVIERFDFSQGLRRKIVDFVKLKGESRWILIGFVNGDVRKMLKSDEISVMGEE